MFVIGTAGHVDHGKSTLVRALTGINPDRLREEQEREMTIDLGFAWLTLPSGREVSIVDVPGHEDFIKNMLAGIGGIDVALFVVAADESVMPQTREHLAILDLLGIPRGVIALTKIDLVEDPEWLELVQEEIRDQVKGTVLEKAAIVPVSAVTGEGLSDLLAELDRLLDQARPRADCGRPRLGIDRVFTISGFGTVVTGTLIDGRLRVGDEVEIVPGELRARIRGLQTHKVKVDEALPGTRVAINLSGVSVDDLWRGQVVTYPGWLRPTVLLDARFHLLASAPWSLKHNAAVEFFVGSARTGAHVRLLDAEELRPGQDGWVQFRLNSPIAVVRGDRFIVRLASPSITLGGGEVVQPHPRRRHKRFRPEVLAYLEELAQGTPVAVLRGLLRQGRIMSVGELLWESNLPEEQARRALEELVDRGEVVLLGGSGQGPLRKEAGALLQSEWAELVERVKRALQEYHQRYPLRWGMPREELRSRVRKLGSFFNVALARAEEEGVLLCTETSVRLPEHEVRLSTEQEQAVAQVLAKFRDSPFTPPTFSQVEERLGGELLQYLLEEGKLVKVSDNVLFDAETLMAMRRRLVSYLQEHGQVTVAQVRDLFRTSRRYALGFLEYMDRSRVTKRLGDIRVLRGEQKDDRT
ncbi:MAG: selenocysteine-specific translation elongation factor [Anaerolineae bacterium]|nr:selenocysteine-specific translation elongation factor [Anaerolineae bacterium]